MPQPPSDVEPEVRDACHAGRWFEGAGRAVPAPLIRELLLAEPAGAPAIRIRRARIEGYLDLNYLESRVPLLLEGCELTGRPRLYWARLGYVSFQGSTLPGLIGSNARVDGHLRLTRAVLSGELRLPGARIGGSLLLDGARLANAGATALHGERLHVEGELRGTRLDADGTINLDHARVDGRLTLDDARLRSPAGTVLVGPNLAVAGGVSGRRAVIDGEISLSDARVGGAVIFTAARLGNPQGVALRLSRAVLGGVFLGGGFRAEGEIRLRGAQISNGLNLSGASLANPGGAALDADAVHVQGDLECRQGFRAEGGVLLRNAVVSDWLGFEGASLGNSGAVALNATGIQVGRVIACRDGFTADGEVRLTGAQVGSMVSFNGARLAADGPALVAFRLAVRELDLRFAEPVGGQVNLAHATVGILHDAPATWPRTLRLDGLSYQALRPPLRPDQRLAWLRRGDAEYLPQPYEQLARLYRNDGDDRAARAVHLAQQRHRRGTLSWPARLWGWLQDVTVGYGYQPGRAALWLAALLIAGTVWFAAHHPAAGSGTPPAFNPFLYTLDLLLPIIDLGQQSGYPPVGTAPQVVADLLIVAGWTLATTIAAGITRTLRRD